MVPSSKASAPIKLPSRQSWWATWIVRPYSNTSSRLRAFSASSRASSVSFFSSVSWSRALSASPWACRAVCQSEPSPIPTATSARSNSTDPASASCTRRRFRCSASRASASRRVFASSAAFASAVARSPSARTASSSACRARSSASARYPVTSCATSAASRGRSSRLAARHRLHSSTNPGSAPQASSRAKASAVSPRIDIRRTKSEFDAEYAGLPVRIAQRTAPSPNTSARSSISSTAPCACSGAMNAGVPSTLPACVARSASRSERISVRSSGSVASISGG